jgi:hypothetical protein
MDDWCLAFITGRELPTNDRIMLASALDFSPSVAGSSRLDRNESVWQTLLVEKTLPHVSLVCLKSTGGDSAYGIDSMVDVLGLIVALAKSKALSDSTVADSV